MPWFDHLKNFDSYKFGQFYINKHITNVVAQVLTNLPEEKIKECPKILIIQKNLTDFGIGLSIGQLILPCVDGGRKWRVGPRETEIRPDGWCDGGLW